MVLKTNEPDKPPANSKDDEPKTVKSEPKQKPAGPLARAAEASDPAVHQLLAERGSYESHLASADDSQAAVDGTRDVAKDKIDEIDDKLADLGYTAK